MAKSSIEERVTIQQDLESPSPSSSSPLNHRHRCCFHLPCFRSSTRHITLGGPTSPTHPPPSLWNTLWARPLWAFKKVREWSEIVAGPKWKTFIRRFNRRRNVHRHQFQYDPLSYALNFDDGQGQNCHFDDDVYDFSSRLAASPIYPSAKVSVSLAIGGAPC